MHAFGMQIEIRSFHSSHGNFIILFSVISKEHKQRQTIDERAQRRNMRQRPTKKGFFVRIWRFSEHTEDAEEWEM